MGIVLNITTVNQMMVGTMQSNTMTGTMSNKQNYSHEMAKHCGQNNDPLNILAVKQDIHAH